MNVLSAVEATARAVQEAMKGSLGAQSVVGLMLSQDKYLTTKWASSDVFERSIDAWCGSPRWGDNEVVLVPKQTAVSDRAVNGQTFVGLEPGKSVGRDYVINLNTEDDANFDNTALAIYATVLINRLLAPLVVSMKDKVFDFKSLPIYTDVSDEEWEKFVTNTIQTIMAEAPFTEARFLRNILTVRTSKNPTATLAIMAASVGFKIRPTVVYNPTFMREMFCQKLYVNSFFGKDVSSLSFKEMAAFTFYHEVGHMVCGHQSRNYRTNMQRVFDTPVTISVASENQAHRYARKMTEKTNVRTRNSNVADVFPPYASHGSAFSENKRRGSLDFSYWQASETTRSFGFDKFAPFEIFSNIKSPREALIIIERMANREAMFDADDLMKMLKTMGTDPEAQNRTKQPGKKVQSSGGNTPPPVPKTKFKVGDWVRVRRTGEYRKITHILPNGKYQTDDLDPKLVAAQRDAAAGVMASYGNMD